MSPDVNKSPFPIRIQIEYLWILVVIIGVFVFANTHPIRPNDFWWHMAVGRQIRSTGEIPAVDEYSYTMENQPYPSYQMFWLPEIGLYTLYDAGGPEFVVIVNSLILTLTYAILIWICFKAAGSWRIAAVATLIAIGFGINNWNVRPQILSYLLGVLFLLGIYGYRRRSNPAWIAIFPLSMLLWANSHGSFPIGFVFLGIWFADELWKIMQAWPKKEPARNIKNLVAPGIAILLTSIASLANPQGLGIISYVSTLSSNSVVQNLVIEWAPPTLNTQVGAIFILGFILCIAIFIYSPKRLNFFQFVTFLVFSILAFKTVRGGVWFGFAMAPVIADQLSALGRTLNLKYKQSTRKRGFHVLNQGLMAILLLVAIISLPWFRRILPLPGAKSSPISLETPVAATEFLLRESPAGNLFHEMGFGSYLIWAAQPDYKVFVDPRIELYSREIWEEYIILNNALPGWEDYLKNQGVGVMMLSPYNQATLIQESEDSKAWTKVYEDDAAVIFVKEGG